MKKILITFAALLIIFCFTTTSYTDTVNHIDEGQATTEATAGIAATFTWQVAPESSDLPQAEVSLWAAGVDRTTATPLLTQKVDVTQDGTFQLTNLQPGNYDITFKLPYSLRAVANNVTVTQNAITPVNFEEITLGDTATSFANVTETEIASYVFHASNIIIDDSGNPHINAIIDDSGLEHFHRQGADWTSERIEVNPYPYHSNTIIGADGKCRVIFIYEGQIFCATRESAGVWRHELISPQTWVVFTFWATIGPDGKMHVVYYQGDDFETALWYAVKGTNDESWDISLIESGFSTKTPWVGVSQNGTVTVLYQLNNSLRMSCKTVSGWNHKNLYTFSSGTLNWFSVVATNFGNSLVLSEKNSLTKRNTLRWGTVNETNLAWDGYDDTLDWSLQNIPAAFVSNQIIATGLDENGKPVLKPLNNGVEIPLNHKVTGGDILSPAIISLAGGPAGKLSAVYKSSCGLSCLVYAETTALGNVIAVSDYSAILNSFGTVPKDEKYIDNCDLNRDGVVDVTDYCIVLYNLGKYGEAPF